MISHEQSQEFHMKKISKAFGLTIIAAAFTAAATPALAQAWKQGMTPEQANSTLAPHAGKATVTPATDIPLSKLKLPKGFVAEVWSTGTPGGRAMAMGDNGKIYVGTRALGRVYEISDNGKERASRVVIDKLTQPAGVAFRNGSL
jgi:glucose/arabinose dehydrogenase